MNLYGILVLFWTYLDGSSVAVALSWFLAILVNKICRIMKIFEQLDHLKTSGKQLTT